MDRVGVWEGRGQGFGSLPALSTVQTRSLLEVDASHNDLDDVEGSWLVEAPLLRCLSLSHNRLSFFPSSCLRLVHLRSLYLNNNEIVTIPPAIGALLGLQVLYLHNNLIQNVPEEMCLLPCLARVRLDNNRISLLPSAMEEMRRLTLLKIDHNNFAFQTENLSNQAPLQLGMLAMRASHLQAYGYAAERHSWLPEPLKSVFSILLRAHSRGLRPVCLLPLEAWHMVFSFTLATELDVSQLRIQAREEVDSGGEGCLAILSTCYTQ
jgi:hypothetical protein